MVNWIDERDHENLNDTRLAYRNSSGDRSMKELVGEVLGNYRIESLIDEGGMGRVYRARHILLDRLAAIKIMLPELETSPGYRARFHQEARAAAALRHPNIVQILDFGEQGGRFFLVMELVPDGDMLGIMRGQRASKPLSLALGLNLVRQAALGLDYAHRRGMVHRDVKPKNFLLEASENKDEGYTLKASDFGLARLKEGGIETSIGKIRGTLAYMSPEQCRGLDLDGRSDLYALGIILFELGTGHRPFEIKSPIDALYKHIYEPPPSPPLATSVRISLPTSRKSSSAVSPRILVSACFPAPSSPTTFSPSSRGGTRRRLCSDRRAARGQHVAPFTPPRHRRRAARGAGG